MKVFYNIVQTVAGKLTATCPTDVIAWAKVNGRAVLRFNQNRVHRSELQGQPIISGLCGPMYDGEKNGVPVIRYEDQETNDFLSR